MPWLEIVLIGLLLFWLYTMHLDEYSAWNLFRKRRRWKRRVEQGLNDGTLVELPPGTYERVRHTPGVSEHLSRYDSWLRSDKGEYYIKRPGETVTVENGKALFSLESVPVALEPVAPTGSSSRRRESYATYLRSPEWKARRQQALERAGHRCQICNRSDRLEVHHRSYRNIFNESPDDLTVLCARCHRKFHQAGNMPER
jgi:hypothetical protein